MFSHQFRLRLWPILKVLLYIKAFLYAFSDICRVFYEPERLCFDFLVWFRSMCLEVIFIGKFLIVYRFLLQTLAIKSLNWLIMAFTYILFSVKKLGWTYFTLTFIGNINIILFINSLSRLLITRNDSLSLSNDTQFVISLDLNDYLLILLRNTPCYSCGEAFTERPVLNV